MRHLLLFAVAVLGIAAVAPRLYMDATRSAETGALGRTHAPAPPSQAAGYRAVTIPRGPNGHFEVDASVNSRRMRFLIDTGASVVVLRESEAARLGAHPSARDYRAKVTTANGVVMAAPTELNRVEVGGLVVHNVAALILPDKALAQNLLGMSFLSRVRFEHKNGRLVLEQ